MYSCAYRITKHFFFSLSPTVSFVPELNGVTSSNPTNFNFLSSFTKQRFGNSLGHFDSEKKRVDHRAQLTKFTVV